MGEPSKNHSPTTRLKNLPSVDLDQSRSTASLDQSKSADTSFLSSVYQTLSSISGISSSEEPSKLHNPSHPLEPYLPLISRFFILTSLASIILSKLHWSLSLVSIVVGCHVLWKQLERLGRDIKWRENQIEVKKQVSFAGSDWEAKGGNRVLEIIEFYRLQGDETRMPNKVYERESS